jgi:hypothetical protein
MPVTYAEIIPGTLLTDSAATLYTVAAGVTTNVGTLWFCNTDTSNHTYTVYIIAEGDSAADASTVVTAEPIAAGQTKSLTLDQNLPSGSFIQALADTTSVVSVRGSDVNG